MILIIDEPWIQLHIDDRKTLINLLEIWIEQHLKVKVKCRMSSTEVQPEGHDWHADNCKVLGTGYYLPYGWTEDWQQLKWVPNHMPWCFLSASLLISDPTTFQGGQLQFWDSKEKCVKAFKSEVQNKIVLFTSGKENVHRVTPHFNGERSVHLFFFEKV